MPSGTQGVKQGGITAWFGRGKRRAQLAESLYVWTVAEARRPEWYAAAGVPDTLDGRFDLILLHLFAVMERLGRTPRPRKLQRVVVETFFRDMDRSLREIGSSDTGLPRRMKAMGEAYLGRMQAYRAARLGGAEAWNAALTRNLYADDAAEPRQLAKARELFDAWEAKLAAQPDAALLSGTLA